MQDQFFSQHWLNQNNNPAGGVSSGKGVCISWQNGPLSVTGTRLEPNGAFVETVIAMVIDRIVFYQQSKFNSKYNERALSYLHAAIGELNARTSDREKRSVEGTHEV